MERKFINSSVIESVAYDAQKEVLEVHFPDGQVKRYYDVAAETYSELMSAASHGRYFLSKIRGKHPSEKIKDKSRTS